VRGEPLTARVEPLVRDLLALESVVAVVRQDSGRAMLVARERDGLLVLDHFRQPPTAPRLGLLVERLEQARSVALVARLAAPTPSTALLGRGDKGNFVEIDRAMLEELDEAALAAAPLLGEPFAPETAKYTAPPALVDRVLVQAPFGEDGRELVVRARLSADGIAWAQALGGAPLAGNVDALALPDAAPVWQPPANLDLELALRGTDTDAIMFHGLSRVPTLLRAIEAAHPGAIDGSLSAWHVELEGGDPAPTLVGEPLARLREQLAAGKYEIDVEFPEGRTMMELRLRPQ
jgi:hypothetical protein